MTLFVYAGTSNALSGARAPHAMPQRHTQQGAPAVARAAWCVVVLSNSFRPIANRCQVIQLAECALVKPLVQRIPEMALPVVEDDGLAWAQVASPVRVRTDEHVHQPAGDPANLGRQTPRIDPLGCHEISTPVVVTSTGVPTGGQ